MLAALWLRPLWQRPARALATVAGVAVGVGAVLATGLASRAAVASLTDDVEALSGAARLEVTRPGGVPVEHMALLAPLTGLARVAPVVEDVALVPARGELVRLLGVDALALDELAEGAPLDGDAAKVGERLLRGEGVVLSRAAAARLGVAAGESLALVVQSRPVTLEVLALFAPARFASAWEHVLVLDVARAQELLGRDAHLDRLELVPRLAQDLEALQAHAAALLPEGDRVAPVAARRAEGERFVRSLTFNLTALAGVSVLVSIVLVATTLATSVVERRASIALLRSLGASRAQLALAVLLESAAIGLLGGALGVALGALGARAIAEDVHGSFATLSESVLAGAVELEWTWLVGGVALGLASALVAAFLPLQEAWRTPPAQHLRGWEEPRPSRPLWRAVLVAALLGGAWVTARLPAWSGRPIWALVSSLLLLGTILALSGPLIDALARLPTGWLGLRLATPLRLAQAALGAARRRAAWAASAVGVAVALAVAMGAMVGSFRANLVDWTAQAMRSDLYVRPLSSRSGSTPGRVAPGAIALATELFGAERVDPYHESAASVGEQRVAFGGAAFAVVAREGGVPFLDAQGERDSRAVFARALAERLAVVNEPFARRFGLWAGDRVRLVTAGGVLEREIAGVYRDYSGHLGRVVVDLADYLPLEGDEGAESVAIFLPEGADVAAEREGLRTALGTEFAVEVLDNREVRGEVLRVFERTFAVTVALQVLASLVAALAIVLVLSALVRERARDLAVIRVLGGSRAQLGGMVAAQALFLGLAGALGGLAVGLVVGYVLVAVVNVQSFGWSLRFALPASVWWTAGAVVPACLVAGWLPAWLSQRLVPQEALRELD